MWRREINVGSRWGSVEDKDHVKDIDVDERILLNRIRRETSDLLYSRR
jgi:hypothetical protein